MNKEDVKNMRDAFLFLREQFPDIVFPAYDYAPLVNVMMAYTPKELTKIFMICQSLIARARMNAYREMKRDFILDTDAAFDMTNALCYAALSIPNVDPKTMDESMNRQMAAGVGAAYVSEFMPPYGNL